MPIKKKTTKKPTAKPSVPMMSAIYSTNRPRKRSLRYAKLLERRRRAYL